jgi:hypothetical protein
VVQFHFPQGLRLSGNPVNLEHDGKEETRPQSQAAQGRSQEEKPRGCEPSGFQDCSANDKGAGLITFSTLAAAIILLTFVFAWTATNSSSG